MHKLKSEAHQRLSHHFLPGGPRNPNPDPEGNQSNNPLLFFFFSFFPSPSSNPRLLTQLQTLSRASHENTWGGKGMEEGVETARIPWRKEWFTRACGEGSDSCLGRTHTHTLTHTRALCLNEKKKKKKKRVWSIHMCVNGRKILGYGVECMLTGNSKQMRTNTPAVETELGQ